MTAQKTLKCNHLVAILSAFFFKQREWWLYSNYHMFYYQNKNWISCLQADHGAETYHISSPFHHGAETTTTTGTIQVWKYSHREKGNRKQIAFSKECKIGSAQQPHIMWWRWCRSAFKLDFPYQSKRNTAEPGLYTGQSKCTKSIVSKDLCGRGRSVQPNWFHAHAERQATLITFILYSCKEFPAVTIKYCFGCILLDTKRIAKDSSETETITCLLKCFNCSNVVYKCNTVVVCSYHLWANKIS